MIFSVECYFLPLVCTNTDARHLKCAWSRHDYRLHGCVNSYRGLFHTSAPFKKPACSAVYTSALSIPHGAISKICKPSIMRDFVAFLIIIL